MSRREGKTASEAVVAMYLLKNTDRLETMTRPQAVEEMEQHIGKPVTSATIGKVAELAIKHGWFKGFAEKVESPQLDDDFFVLSRIVVHLCKDMGYPIPESFASKYRG